MLTAILEHLKPCIAIEKPMDELNQTLRSMARLVRPAAVGALRLTCADESERECIDSFRRWFVMPLLPTMKFWSKSPFRLANLGGQYEPGALRIAEDHFATPASRHSFKLMLAKVNSHVSVESVGGDYVYGEMERYDSESVFCGALHALMAGSDLPFARGLRAAFQSQGRDRLAELLDPSRVKPKERALAAALVNARLQSERLAEEALEFAPKSPTVYVVVAGVTLNSQGRDTEILCGVHAIDRRGEESERVYVGLGDSPGGLLIDHRYGVLRVSDSSFPK